ncbi:hypothetical protein Fmac_011585 [Flemingia macrophylla]|uniref:Uncharacterized protein n=1 Tax=Flemingia macrophylla TaxID=520843 RepID=A0ABD1MMW1_9FABA
MDASCNGRGGLRWWPSLVMQWQPMDVPLRRCPGMVFVDVACVFFVNANNWIRVLQVNLLGVSNDAADHLLRRLLEGIGSTPTTSEIVAAKDIDDIWNSATTGLGTNALYRAAKGV